MGLSMLSSVSDNWAYNGNVTTTPPFQCERSLAQACKRSPDQSHYFPLGDPSTIQAHHLSHELTLFLRLVTIEKAARDMRFCCIADPTYQSHYFLLLADDLSRSSPTRRHYECTDMYR